MANEQQLTLTLGLLLDGLVESHDRLANDITTRGVAYKSLYLDLMGFLSCADQLEDLLNLAGLPKEARDIVDGLSHQIHEARNYYQHIAGRIRESLKEGDIALGAISTSQPNQDGSRQISGMAQISNTGATVIPISGDLFSAHPEPVLVLDLKTKKVSYHINLTGIKNKAVQLQGFLDASKS